MMDLAIAASPSMEDTWPVKVYLSEKDSLESLSHFLGQLGDFSEGQPGAPSAGKGSLLAGPWWWQ